MDFENISPYVRFAARQHMINSQDYSSIGNELVGLDNRIYLCNSGSGTVTVGGTQYVLNQGDLLMWRSGTPYSYASTSSDFSCFTCNFDYYSQQEKCSYPQPPVPSALFHPNQLFEPNFQFDQQQFPFNNTVYLNNAFYLIPDVESLVAEYENRFKYYNLRCQVLLTKILLELLRHLEFYNGNSQQYSLVDDITTYIQQHYAEPISNESIGKQFGYHPVYINSLMRKIANTSLHQYVIATRLHQAIQMMMETTLSVEEISLAVGFSTPQYLTRLFKARFGVSPSVFRTQI